MFLLPDGENWINPKTGEQVDLLGKRCDPNNDLVEQMPNGMFRKHPMPDKLHPARGAKRGQLNAKDYHALVNRGMSKDDIARMNDEFLLGLMRPE